MQLRNIQAKALNKEWHHGIVSNSSTIKRERSGAKTKNFAVWPPEQANTEDLAHNNVSVLSPFSHVQLSATPWAVARQAPLSIGLPRQEYWTGLPFPLPGDIPHPGIQPGSSAVQAGSLPTEPPFYLILGLLIWKQSFYLIQRPLLMLSKWQSKLV